MEILQKGNESVIALVIALVFIICLSCRVVCNRYTVSLIRSVSTWMASLALWRHLLMAPRSRYLRPAQEASSIPCRTARTNWNYAPAWLRNSQWCKKQKRRCFFTNGLKRSALYHCLQLSSGGIGQSFPQIQNLNHRQDAELFRQAGAPQLFSLIKCIHASVILVLFSTLK